MPATQAPELALAQSQAAGQGIDAPLVQCSQLDQRQRAGYRVRRAPPGPLVRCRLRPAPQARAEPRLLGRGGGGIERHVLRPGRARRTDRTAIDAGRLHGNEEPAVEANVAQRQRAVARVVLEIHAGRLRPRPGRRLAGFGRRHSPASPPRRRYLASRSGRRSSKRKSPGDAPSITVWVRVSFTAGLKPSTSEKSRLQESSAPISGMPTALYISAYRHRVTLNENLSSLCSSTSMR